MDTPPAQSINATPDSTSPFAVKIDSVDKLMAIVLSAHGNTYAYSEYMTPDDFWKMREYLRMSYMPRDHRQVTYATLLQGIDTNPYDFTPTHEHYLHVSTQDQTKLAFTENADKGRRDIQLRMTPGKYVKRFFPTMPDADVRLAASNFEAFYGKGEPLLKAQGDDELVRVINEGPSESCMQGLSYNGHVHPAVIYNSPDIEVLYIERGGDIVARTIANAMTKKCARIYGDSSRMCPALEREGYEQEVGALIGCRIARIENQGDSGRGHIMAYVDAGTGSGGGSLGYEPTDTDVWWKLTGSYNHGNTYEGYDNGGVTNDGAAERCTCERCGDYTDEDDMTYIEHEGRSVCQGCLDDRYVWGVFNNRGAEGHINNNNAIYVECRDKYYADWIDLSNFDLIYTEDGKWAGFDEVIADVNGGYYLTDDCTQVGGNGDGAMYVVTNEMHNYADRLFMVNDKWVHVDSYEYEQFMEDQEDAAENEMDTPIVKPQSMQDAADALARVWRFHIQEELCRLCDRALFGTEVVTIEPFGLVEVSDDVVGRVALRDIRGVMGSEYITGRRSFGITSYKAMCQAFKVSLPVPQARAEVPMPPLPQADDVKPLVSWREVYLDAQSKGVEFDYYSEYDSTWSSDDGRCSFSRDYKLYRLSVDNTREGLKAAQAAGVRFDCLSSISGKYRPDDNLCFDAPMASYRVRVPVLNQRYTATWPFVNESREVEETA